MARKTATEKIKALLEERETIKKGYSKAAEHARKDYDELEKEFHKIDGEVSAIYKSYVLGTITAESYNQEKQRLDKADELLRDAGYKISEIQRYLKEDLMELMVKIEAVMKDYHKEKLKAETCLKYKALQAKYDYMEKVKVLSDEYKEVWKFTKEYEQLQVELGLKDYSYSRFDNTFSTFSPYNISSSTDIDISRKEMEAIYTNGKYDTSLLKVLEKGKVEGYI